MFFVDMHEVHRAWENRHVELQAKIKVRITDHLIQDDGSFETRNRQIGRAHV